MFQLALNDKLPRVTLLPLMFIASIGGDHVSNYHYTLSDPLIEKKNYKILFEDEISFPLYIWLNTCSSIKPYLQACANKQTCLCTCAGAIGKHHHIRE